MKPSRVFARIDQPSTNLGGRGHKSPTKVIRVPVDACSELDALLSSWRLRLQRSAASPKGLSPRYYYLAQFLEELEDIFPDVVPF